jgi:protein-S-isoprenylcysteine O-methyltransferase Ste14
MLRQTLIRTVAVLALLAGLLYGLAGTVHWAGAAVLLAALGGGGLMMSLWLARCDPALLRLRVGDRSKPAFDRILLPLLNLLLFSWLVLMALDVRRHGTAQMPLWANLLGGAAILACFFLVLRVMRENTFATAVVKHQPERGHKVIDSGPYAMVRHPMYAAAVAGYAAIPFTLGSWRGLTGILPLILVLALRTLFEEGLLARQLPGYCEYRKRVRYRFVPFVW